uniref:Acetoacetate decarboxylase n=1 Tax=Arcella intermedia TaxID=1963864 RepID=A0A6B2L431_9EUKA
MQYPSTPLNSPSYPKGPYFFQNREYFIVYYESDIESIKKVVPAPLVPKSNIVAYEWIKMPDSTGFGSYQESGTVIPCILNGRNINFTTQMFLNDEPPIAAGREIWGFPKKRADPEFSVHQDTIYGKLEYNGQTAAWGTMTYKHHEIPEADAIRSLTSTSVNLKIIPDVDLKPKICQLVGYNLILKKLHGAWKGSARLHLIPHANAPTADLPVRKVLYGAHYLADIILPYGEVLYDYLSPENINKTSPPSYAFPEEKVRDTLCMPPISPSYTPPPIVFKDREYFMILYRTKLEALRPLIPDLFTINKEGRVIVQWIFTKSHGIGAYTKFVVLVPVKDKRGKSFLFEVNEFSDSSAAITMGREVYGQPYKYAKPSISVNQDTVLGHLNFSGLDVAQGTMPYKESELDESIAMEFLSTPHVNIKLIHEYQDSFFFQREREIAFDSSR